ncbi:MAG: hemolysin family protein [bacterium]|nr:hemolysin family protein [bacterium]MDD5354323.1 hemolysin family protein [bacterium]MDD5756526.1 hemolysin family protein [bacterium]
MFISFIILIILLLGSFFFSATETALTSLDRYRIKTLIEERKVKSLQMWVDHPNKILAAILVGNTIVNLAAAALTTYLAVHFSSSLHITELWAAILATILITLVILILGEITPKTFAKHLPEVVAVWTIKLIVLIHYLLAPVIKGLIFITNPLVKLLGGNIKRDMLFDKDEEIRFLVSEGVREGVLGKDQKEMIHGVLEFGDKVARDIMIPRIDMECVDITLEKEKFIDLVVEAGHSRVPIYQGSLDNIIGIIHVKDLLNAWRCNELIVIQDLIRPVYFVPETQKVNNLLRQMQKGRLHMAVVVDEYGVPSGLITMEDLVEQIVGDILDEYDIEDLNVEPMGDGSVQIDGKMNIYEVNEKLKINLPSEDFNTVSGFVVDLLGRVPRKDEEIRYKDLRFTIVETNRRRIITLKVKKEAAEGPKT